MIPARAFRAIRGPVDRGTELGTSLLIRAVENGFVVDTEWLVHDDPYFVDRPRFVKYIAPTLDDLMLVVGKILDSFEGRKPNPSERIQGNFRMSNVDLPAMTIHLLKGGFISVAARPVKRKMEAAYGRPHPRRYPDAAEEEPEVVEVMDTEFEEEIIVSRNALLSRILSFFATERGK